MKTKMLDSLKRFSRNAPAKAGLAAGLLAASNFASAAAINIDVEDVVGTLGAAIITVTAVCTAALSIVVVVRVFKYVRAAL